MLDLLVALTAMLVLSPLLLVVALAIKLHDRGPVLYVRERVGRDGRRFSFLKFRSMPTDSPSLSSDEASELAVTPVGRVIRRTSIDELPQFVNIIKGDMSVVGPRPPLPSQSDLIELRRATGVLSLRPGLTGLAQVNAYDGMPPEEKARWDEEYATRISLALDARIILSTFRYLLKPPPRY